MPKEKSTKWKPPTSFVAHSSREMQQFARALAKDMLRITPGKGAVVLGLEGNLGSGKTTFAQGFAEGLGIREKVLSPTFVIMKKYATKHARFRALWHIDCYRIAGPQDMRELGWEEIIKDPYILVVVEWPERIRRILPADTLLLKFVSQGKSSRKVIVE